MPQLIFKFLKAIFILLILSIFITCTHRSAVSKDDLARIGLYALVYSSISNDTCSMLLNKQAFHDFMIKYAKMGHDDSIITSQVAQISELPQQLRTSSADSAFSFWLRQNRYRFTPKHKDMLFAVAYHVISADGKFIPNEKWFMKEFNKELDYPKGSTEMWVKSFQKGKRIPINIKR